MIKKIEVSQLKVGMYIHDLNCHWMAHPFARNRFKLSSESQIEKIRQGGFVSVFIDTTKGLDAKDAHTRKEAADALEQELIALVESERQLPRQVSLYQELAKASEIRNQAQQKVRDVMQDVRLGKMIALDEIDTVVQDITDSILRNSSALIGLLHIKNKDDYTFLHSVGVSALLVSFCISAGMDKATVRQAGLGGLLHDIGKAKVPEAILNKQGKLTDEEFGIIKGHPRDGCDLLSQIAGIGPIPLDIALHHHERFDGSGYPDRLIGKEINELAQMAAIVDVYDAITSDRCYHTGMCPAEALRKMHEWSNSHFDTKQIQAFMRCVGIYPVGTLVKLESGLLGFVVEHQETKLLTPRVKVFYNTRSNSYISPHELDLSKPLGKGGGDRIVSYESPAKWKLDQSAFSAMIHA